jgi:hypothetical protein
MGVRFAMPMWLDFAFANLVTLLSEAGFKVSPVHYLYPSDVRSNRGFQKFSTRAFRPIGLRMTEHSWQRLMDQLSRS